MNASSVVPLIDLVFLTLGSVLGAMSQMSTVEALPVELARVGNGSAIVQAGKFEVLSLTDEGLTHKGDQVSDDQLGQIFKDGDVVLRADQSISAHRMLEVLAELARSGASVTVEVKQEASNTHSGKGKQR